MRVFQISQIVSGTLQTLNAWPKKGYSKQIVTWQYLPDLILRSAHHKCSYFCIIPSARVVRPLSLNDPRNIFRRKNAIRKYVFIVYGISYLLYVVLF